MGKMESGAKAKAVSLLFTFSFPPALL